ncbi:hypothetical protein EJB05_04453 [Eragrostis curvula]|uniref:Uncharacterized protein n=1 Tax=Eragrostis curvula TaxID=38414 RepID=A0A5J9WAP8_9POAL|nr:hypothetical protein EJB05_04453 [Eragrostis curvula]
MAVRSHGPVRRRPEELIAGPFSSESTESLTRSSSPVKHALRRTSLLAPVSRLSWWNRAYGKAILMLNMECRASKQHPCRLVASSLSATAPVVDVELMLELHFTDDAACRIVALAMVVVVAS